MLSPEINLLVIEPSRERLNSQAAIGLFPDLRIISPLNSYSKQLLFDSSIPEYPLISQYRTVSKVYTFSFYLAR